MISTTTDSGRLSSASFALRVAAAALVFTLAVVALPFARFAYQAPTLHVILETANSVIALVVAYLVYGRFRHGRHLQDLLLGMALGTVAVASLVMTAVPSAIAVGGGTSLTAWAPLVVRFLGTVVLAAAALTPPDRRVGRGRAASTAVGFFGVVGALGAGGLAWGGHLPPAVDPLAVGDGSRPVLDAHPIVLAIQVLGIGLYALAATGFARQADRRDDQLLRWLAAGCVLASAARVHYLLYPSLYSEYVYSGDVLRLGFYLFLLVGAAREITSFWAARTEAAVLEDRRRMARDLHDGVIQELSYIYAQSRRLVAHPGDTATVERIGGAAGRAIDESRRAIAALTSAHDESVASVLRHSLEEMATRYEVKVVTDLDPAAEADGPMAEALLRITGEAVRNAVRHGAATRIDVQLTAAPLALVVSDNGCGFPADRPDGGRAGGFGLRSMRERAESIGATLVIESAPGEGTTVRTCWS